MKNNDDFLWEKNLETFSSSDINENNIIDFPEAEQITPSGNQGRVHSQSQYNFVYKNLKFHTDYERAFYKALEKYIYVRKDQSIGIRAQCPIESFNGKKIFRCAPDTEIIYKGWLCVIEKDGDSHLYKSPEEEQNRLNVFNFNNCIVYRINSPELGYDQQQLDTWAENAVQRTFDFLDRVIEGRAK